MPVFSKLPLADVPSGPAGAAVKPEAVAPRPEGGHHRAPLRFGSPLSRRELEVLRAAAVGMSNKEIAFSLKPEVTQTTVKTHFSAIFIRLGANDRAHAVAIGIREGYIELGPSQHTPPSHLTRDEITVLREIIRFWAEILKSKNGPSRPW